MRNEGEMSVASTTTPPQQRRRIVRLHPDARRKQIVREATRLISEAGFNGVSLAHVAQACGIRKPSVLYYFPSMFHLLEAVLQQVEVTDFIDVRDTTTPADPTTAREYFTRLLDHHMSRREITGLYVIVGAEAISARHPAHGYFTERTRRVRDELRRLLLWKQDPDAAAVELLAFWQGLEIESLRTPELDVLAVRNQFCDRFFA